MNSDFKNCYVISRWVDVSGNVYSKLNIFHTNLPPNELIKKITETNPLNSNHKLVYMSVDDKVIFKIDHSEITSWD